LKRVGDVSDPPASIGLHLGRAVQDADGAVLIELGEDGGHNTEVETRHCETQYYPYYQLTPF